MPIEPFSQDLKLTAPWACISRLQAPEGWTFDNMILCHNTQNLFKTACCVRESLKDGYSLRAVYLAGSVIEIPLHLHGLTIPR